MQQQNFVWQPWKVYLLVKKKNGKGATVFA
jgi:hypothetical protein